MGGRVNPPEPEKVLRGPRVIATRKVWRVCAAIIIANVLFALGLLVMAAVSQMPPAVIAGVIIAALLAIATWVLYYLLDDEE